jgi:NADH:ubiquinone oxidoreductase subunit 6 (subunit J)
MKKALFVLALTLINISVIGNSDLLAQDAAPVSDEGTGWIDIVLYISYIMVIVAALGAIILPLLKAAGDPKSLIRSGIGVVAILAIFVVAYAISGNEVRPTYAPFDVDAGESKLIGGAIITSYLLIFIALGSIIYTEISNLVK